MRLGLLHLRGKDYDQSKALGPLGLGYLAAFMEDRLGFTDVFIEVDDPARLLQKNPDIVGISSFTETFEEVIQHARYLKSIDPKLPIIVGGEHISALPESLPEAIDIGVCGEGEETLTEIMQLYLHNNVTADNLGKINGIVFWHQGQRVVTPPRNWIMELDTIPPPKRELLHREDEVWQQSIFTARGCPYKCTFCASTKFWQRTRYHSVERVMYEIGYIVGNYPQQPLISINDDLFPLNKKRLREMVKAIRDKGYHRQVGFTLNARASVFDEEIAELIAAMNGQVVCFGFESASNRILKLLKGKTTVEENQRALDLCERYGFAVVGNFMTGAPDEYLTDMGKTYWFVRQNAHKIWRPNICFSTPFPGTEFWTDAVDRNLIGDDFKSWGLLDLGFKPGESVYMNKYVPEEEFQPIYDYFVCNNKKVDDLRTDFYQMKTKRDYLEEIYGQIAREFPQAVSQALEVGNESVNMRHLLDQPDIEKARVYHGEVDLSPYQDRQFPLIVVSHALEKMKDPQRFLQGIRPLLAEGGDIVFLTYNAYHISFLIELLYGRWDPAKFGIYQRDHLTFHTIPSLVKHLQESDFAVERVEKLKLDDERFAPFFKEILPLVGQAVDTSQMRKSVDAFSSLIFAKKTPARLKPIFSGWQEATVPLAGMPVLSGRESAH